MHPTIIAALALLGLAAGAPAVAPLVPAIAASPDSTAQATPGEMKAATAPAAAPAKGATQGALMKTATGQEVVVLETKQGDIVIRLLDKDAPKTAANFRKLVASKFYDGTCFHRVIPGFMIQGGDPNSKNSDPSDDGIGGPGYTVPAEIKLKHLRGSVATARQGDQVNPARASSGSQFFIDLAPQPSLDAGGYTVFGEVVRGMDAVDKIAALANEPGLASAAGGGVNPQQKAIIKRAYVAPLSRFEKTAAAPKAAPAPAASAAPAAASDTTKQ